MNDDLIIANWKSNGDIKSVVKWCEDIKSSIVPVKNREICIAPPFVFLSRFVAELGYLLHKHSFFSLGAQDLSPYPQGAYTGEISGDALKEVGCRYVLIGHSERRLLFKETSAILENKLKAALDNKITPIFCVGENQTEKNANKTQRVIKRQLAPIMNIIGQSSAPKLVIAYEPIWAIGTNRAASVEIAQKVHSFIKSLLESISIDLADKTKILYGGSVNPDNAKTFLNMPAINGLLVGGASLNGKSILKIYSS